MSETVKYVANGGQTYLPCQDNVNVPFAAYEKPEKTKPITAGTGIKSGCH